MHNNYMGINSLKQGGDKYFTDIKILTKLNLKEDPKETILQSQQNIKINKKNEDIFNIGYLLIYCATGGQNIINFANYICIHDYQCCCLLHCIEKYENKINTKFKISNFINRNAFSKEFLHFLCLTTSYNNQNYPNLTVSKLKRHKLFSEQQQFDRNEINKIFYPMVDLSELLKITNVSTLSFNKRRDILDKSNIKRFNGFCESLLMLIQNNEDRDRLSGRISTKYIKSLLTNENKDIIEIANEFGLDINYILEKLHQIYSSLFDNKSKNTID